MKTILILTGLLLIFSCTAKAQDSASASKTMANASSDAWYPEGYAQGTFASDCEIECQPHQTMKNLIEGRVAFVSCLQSCQQRKVWEKLAVSIGDVADALKKNSYAEILAPLEIKVDTLNAKINSLEKKVDSLKPPEKQTSATK